MSSCSKCGKCHSFCPLYRYFLDERYAPRGKVHLLEGYRATGVGHDDFIETVVWACLQCGACEHLCPSKAEVAEAIRRERSEMGAPYVLREILSRLSHMGKSSTSISRMLKGLALGSGIVSRLFKVTPWGLPEVPRSSFFEEISIQSPWHGKGSTLFFVGCCQNYLFPEIPMKAKRLFGDSLFVPPGQTCCGLPAWSSGLTELARDLVKKNLDALSQMEDSPILTFCSSCAYMIKNVWPRLFEEGSSLWRRAVAVSRNLVAMGEFLVKKGPRNAPSVRGVSLHIPCHERHGGETSGLDLKGMARELNWAIEETVDACCGQGGGFASRFSSVSAGIFEGALARLRRSGPKETVVVTNCSGCLLQWKMGTRDKDGYKVCHPIELL